MKIVAMPSTMSKKDCIVIECTVTNAGPFGSQNSIVFKNHMLQLIIYQEGVANHLFVTGKCGWEKAYLMVCYVNRARVQKRLIARSTGKNRRKRWQ